MTTNESPNLAMEVGVFNSVANARRALEGLLEKGFDKENLSVICSEDKKKDLLDDFPVEEEAGSNATTNVTAGGSVGAILMALGTAAGLTATGGLGLVAIGPILLAAGGGAVAGGFVGLMMSRGIEKEIADYYDQCLRAGKILVGVDVSEDDEGTHAKARDVFSEAGAEPVKLPEG